MKKIRKYLGSRMKTMLILLFLLVPMEAVGAEYIGDIMQYSSTPPFLPGVTEPNILFLLDLSENMVRPAYGICDENLADCENNFVHISDDYDRHIPYYGYFDNGYSDLDAQGKNEMNAQAKTDFGDSYIYDDSYSYEYTCEVGSSTQKYCSKEAGGAWNGNWLNWLTMMQYDIMKKVFVGGNSTTAPENATLNTNSDTDLITNLATLGSSGKMYKVVSDESTGRQPHTNYTTPQEIPFGWYSTPTSATMEGYSTLQTIFGYSVGDDGEVDSDVIRPATLPFNVTLGGVTYPAASSSYSISTYGGSTILYSDGTTDWRLRTCVYCDFTDYDPDNETGTNWGVYVKGTENVTDTNKRIAGSTIKTFLVGTAPNRVFVVSYENMRHVSDTRREDVITFQLLITEGGKKGRSEFIYSYKDVQEDLAWGGATAANTNLKVYLKHQSKDTSADNYESLKEKVRLDFTPADLRNDMALHMTPGSMLYEIIPNSTATGFQPAGVLSPGNDYQVKIYVDVTDKAGDTCDTTQGLYGVRINSNNFDVCTDHYTEGVFHDMRQSEAGGDLGFRLALMLPDNNNEQDGGSLTNNAGGMYFNEEVGTSLIVNIKHASPVENGPLAERMYEGMRYYQQEDPYWTGDFVKEAGACDSASTDPYCYGDREEMAPCCKSFILLISGGNYSDDFQRNIFNDDIEAGDAVPPADAIKAIDMADEGEVVNGGWLDNVAYKLHVTDMRHDFEAADDDESQDITLYVVNTYGEDVGDGTEVLKRAARYGGFNDKDRDDIYDSAVYDCDGDGTNETGEDDRDCDGLPDTYFAPSAGASLKDKITEAINAMLKGSASGTSVSVLSTSAGGQGAVYQAYFYPSKIEGENETRDYTGYMRAFFMDKFQNLRDDASGEAYVTNSDGTTTHSGAHNAKLDTATITDGGDYVSFMHLDTESNMVRVALTEHATGEDVPIPTAGHTPDPLIDELVSIWEAGEVMATIDKDDRRLYTWADLNYDGLIDGGGVASLETPSSYGGALSDAPTDEIMLFNDTNSNTLARFLRADDPDGAFEVISGVNTGFLNMSTEAEDIIDFIRGEYVNGYRNRCITIRGNTSSEDFTTASKTVSGMAGSVGRRGECGKADGESDYGEVWPLGDIIYSTPTLVSGPGERYDEIYGDASYLQFKRRYADRRNVIYVGANDGMLHAFNAGFFHGAETKFCVGNEDSPSDPNGKIDGDMDPDTTSECNSNGAYELGEEMWGFIPHENLPHLQFLACNGTSGDPSACGSSDYHHVFFMDQRPKATDVKIFANNSTTHPGGWGTIIVVGMRYGGGAMDINFNNSSTIIIDEPGEKIRSAYYVFDVTDPEEAPSLLYRFTDDNLGFTTSYPAIARTKEDILDGGGNVIGVNEAWFAVFGSGPKNEVGDKVANRDYNSDATTTQAGYVYVRELGGAGASRAFSTALLNHSSVIMGDPSVVDVDLDFSADVIYMGSSRSATGGAVYRINTGTTPTDLSSWPAMTTLFEDASMGPLYTPVSASMDSATNLWVYFGTGRLRNSADIENTDPQSFYGIKDDCWEDTTDCSATGPHSSFDKLTQLYDATAVEVTLAGVVKPYGSDVCSTVGTAECNYQNLIDYSRTMEGWYFNLAYDETNDPKTVPSERVLARSAVLSGTLMFTAYSPLSSTCDIFGTSNLYALNFETGTAIELPAFEGNVMDANGNDTGVDINATEIQKKLSLGAGMPTAIGVAIGETVSGFVQKSTGEIVRVKTGKGITSTSSRGSWREKTKGGGTVEIEETYKHVIQ